MAEKSPTLRLEDKRQAADRLYAAMFRPEEKKLRRTALIIAIMIHVAFIFARFPEIKQAIRPEEEQRQIIVVRPYVPPPPQIEQKPQIVVQKQVKKVPIPDPTPDQPEPIRAQSPEVVFDAPITSATDVLIGVPEAPPQTGPLLAGVGDVTNPELIQATKLSPVYPELARKARIEGNVILQAVVHKDGTVGEIMVLRCNRPNLGFEESAIEAVRQWRYRPATQNGRPVDVYFTVKVDFLLQ
jgi:periplasmic protein TonB